MPDSFGASDSMVMPPMQGQAAPPGPARLIVRNTFIDFAPESLPEPSAVLRAQTVETAGKYGSRQAKEENRPDGLAEEAEDGSDDEPEDADATNAQAEDQIALQDLTRMTTTDCWESALEWDWSTNKDAQGMTPPGAGMSMVMPSQAGGEAQPDAQPVAGYGGPPIAASGSSMMPQGATMPAPMYMPAGGMMPVQMMPMAMPVAFPVGGDVGGGGMMMPAMMPATMPLSQPNRGLRWPTDTPQEPSPGGLMPGQLGMDPYVQAGMGVQQQQPDTGNPQPHTLTRDQSVSQPHLNRINWTVDARKLRGNDKQAVSPPFSLNFGPQFHDIVFKLMLYPKVVSDSKGGASFKKARGCGFVQLKCEAELSQADANVQWRIVIGGVARGPVIHNFSNSAVSRLPKDKEEWEFSTAVDQDSQTFVVCLEIMPAQPIPAYHPALGQHSG